MSKLVQCKVCGGTVAESAKVCSHCGAKLKKSRWKIVLIVCAILFWIMVISSVFSNGKETKSNSGTAGTDRSNYPEQMDISDYIEIDADVLYEYGEVLVEKKVVTVFQVADTSKGELKAKTDNNDSIFYSIICEFDDQEIGKIYEKESVVTVAGVVKEKSSVDNVVTLEDCHIVGEGEIADKLKNDASAQKEMCQQIQQEQELAKAEALKEEKDKFISECETVKYEEVARNPDNFKSKKIKITGEVIQVSEGLLDGVILRVDCGNSNIWYVTYTHKEGEGRILEGDKITCYGTCDGVESYTTVLGSQVTIPSMKMEYFD